MKYVLVLFLFSFFLWFPTKMYAHTGGGPPFVSVNDELAQTNPYYQGTSSINVAQDVLKKKFLPNEQITFRVDPSKLTIPKDVINESEFTWIFFTGDNFLTQTGTLQIGRTITQSFNTAGSYLVNVYLTYQNDPQLLDTIQLDVIPDSKYVPPIGNIQITQAGPQVSFTTNAKPDPKATIKKSLFDIGDGEIHEKYVLTHTYQTSNFVSFVYNRVIDSNNLVTDVGFQSMGINKKISFTPFSNTTTSPFTTEPIGIAPSFSLIVKVLFGVSSLLVLGVIFLRYRVTIVK